MAAVPHIHLALYPSWYARPFASSCECSKVAVIKFPPKTKSVFFTKWVFPKIGVPQNGWFILETLLKWMISGDFPLFLETPKCSWRFTKGRAPGHLFKTNSCRCRCQRNRMSDIARHEKNINSKARKRFTHTNIHLQEFKWLQKLNKTTTTAIDIQSQKERYFMQILHFRANCAMRCGRWKVRISTFPTVDCLDCHV